MEELTEKNDCTAGTVQARLVPLGSAATCISATANIQPHGRPLADTCTQCLLHKGQHQQGITPHLMANSPSRRPTG